MISHLTSWDARGRTATEEVDEAREECEVAALKSSAEPECNPDSFQATEAAGAELRDGDADAGARRVEEAGEARSFAIAIARIANSLCNSQVFLEDRLSKTSSCCAFGNGPLSPAPDIYTPCRCGSIWCPLALVHGGGRL